jgi:hypothetical protein
VRNNAGRSSLLILLIVGIGVFITDSLRQNQNYYPAALSIALLSAS